MICLKKYTFTTNTFHVRVKRSVQFFSFEKKYCEYNIACLSSKHQFTCMAGKVVGMIKLALDAGKASPAPPVGPALGAKGVNIMAFCKEYNAKTAEKAGTVIPVEITVFEDKSFTFKLKTPPAAVLIKAAAKIDKGSMNSKKQKVGSITMAQVTEIAETKLVDLNCSTVDSAVRTVMGTCANMGVEIES